jgi:hypothetical protein
MNAKPSQIVIIDLLQSLLPMYEQTIATIEPQPTSHQTKSEGLAS